VMLRVPFDVPVAGRLHQLRDYIISSVERFSGLLLDQVDITVDQIEGAGPPDASTATDGGKPEPGRRNRRPRR